MINIINGMEKNNWVNCSYEFCLPTNWKDDFITHLLRFKQWDTSKWPVLKCNAKTWYRSIRITDEFKIVFDKDLILQIKPIKVGDIFCLQVFNGYKGDIVKIKFIDKEFNLKNYPYFEVTKVNDNEISLKNIFLTETKSEFKNRLVYDYFKYVLKPNWINIWNGLINNLINLIDAAMMPEKEIEELIKQELKIIDPETGICSFDDTKITLLDALSSKLFSCIFDMVRDAMNIDVDVRLFNFTHKHVQDKQLTDQIDKWVNDFKNKYWKFVDLSKHSLNNDVIYKRQLWVEPKKAKYTEKSFVECWPEIKEFMREYFSPTGKIIVEIENYIKKLVKETPNILNQKSYSEYLWNYK